MEQHSRFPEQVTPGHSLSGPISGPSGVASSNFTVKLVPVITGTVVMTPNHGGSGGTFSPTSVSLTNASPIGTFTYTPSSKGTKKISITNNRGLFNPAGVAYVAT